MKDDDNAWGDVRILLRMLRGQPRQGSHAERLEAFYAPQASRYDAFRARLLHGREMLVERLDLTSGLRLVELGCGTGSSLDYIGARINALAGVDLVDLCPSLLAVARRRAAAYPHVAVHAADASLWQPQQPVDRVLISYALTMMPNWWQTLANARAMLAPGGRIGIVDFYLPARGRANGFWRRWFAHDGVYLSGEPLAALRELFPRHCCEECRGPVPYLPFLKAPYYLFVGER